MESKLGWQKSTGLDLNLGDNLGLVKTDLAGQKNFHPKRIERKQSENFCIVSIATALLLMEGLAEYVLKYQSNVAFPLVSFIVSMVQAMD